MAQNVILEVRKFAVSDNGWQLVEKRCEEVDHSKGVNFIERWGEVNL
jgi:hypothetical protein